MDQDSSLSVFVVEDEAIIRMFVVEMLEELGHRVVAEAGDINEAVKVAQSALFDLAVFDINLGGTLSFPAADIVIERGIPLIFASGYSPPTESDEYRRLERLQKPYSIDELASAISRARKFKRVG